MVQPAPIQFPMRHNEAQKIVRDRAADSSNVIIGDHAHQRMCERGISDIDVYRILREGEVEGEPTKTEQGEWKVKVCKRLKGNRDAGVVTIILHNNGLFVKTVEWEDI